MKKVSAIVCFAIILSLTACSRQAQTLGETFQPPIDGIEWGMMPDEVMDALSLSEECIQKYIQNDVEWTAVLECGDIEIFERNADVVMVFDLKSQVGLSGISICFEDASEESMAEMLSSVYGEYSAVDAEGTPCRWESEKVEDLTEEIQERFRYVLVDYSYDEGQSGFSKEAMWNTYKSQPLVTVALNGDVLTYSGGHMATYRIFDEEGAYVEWLSYNGIADSYSGD